eukprot:m.194971 g.194971  ORF g.194971 m.194971 type:complete len:741 (+) comp15220_c0_seq10:98-2320(+)
MDTVVGNANDAPSSRDLYRVGHMIRFWGRQARGDAVRSSSISTHSLSSINVDNNVAEGIVETIDNARILHDRILSDCSWAQEGTQREKVRQRSLLNALQDESTKLNRLVPIAREAEATRGDSETRALANQLDRVTRDLEVSRLQLRHAESTREGLVQSRDRLAEYISQGNHLLNAEKPILEGCSQRVAEMKQQNAAARRALEHTEKQIAEVMCRAGHTTEKFDELRLQYLDDLGAAQARVDEQLTRDAQLPCEHTRVKNSSATLQQELSSTTRFRDTATKKQKFLQSRLNMTKIMYDLRQTEMKLAMENHHSTVTHAKRELIEIRQIKEKATKQVEVAKEATQQLRLEAQIVEKKCFQRERELASLRSKITNTRKCIEAREQGMVRISAERQRAQTAWEAMLERREMLETRRRTLATELHLEALLLEKAHTNITAQLADTEKRIESATQQISTSMSAKSVATKSYKDCLTEMDRQQQVADDLLCDAQISLNLAKTQLRETSSSIIEQDARGRRQKELLKMESSELQNSRARFSIPLRELEKELAQHSDDMIVFLARQKVSEDAFNKAKKRMKVLDRRRKTVGTDIKALKDDITRSLQITQSCDEEIISANRLRLATNDRREQVCTNAQAWKQSTSIDSERFSPLIAHIVTENKIVATSYAMWFAALGLLKTAYVTTVRDYNKSRVTMEGLSELRIAQQHTQKALNLETDHLQLPTSANQFGTLEVCGLKRALCALKGASC